MDLGETALYFAGRKTAKPDWHCGPAAHPFDEFICVVRGRIRVRLGKALVIGHPGDVLHYPARTRHEEWADGDGPLEAVVTAFFWKRFRGKRPQRVHDRRGRMRVLAEWIAEENQPLHRAGILLRQHLLDALAAEFLRLSQASESSIVESTRDYICEHLADGLSLDDLARNCHLSKYHFLRVYRQACGLTPMSDLRRIRLETARELLVGTDLPLKAIAARVGLSSEPQLSSALAKSYGVGARQLRARRLAQAPTTGSAI